MNNPREIVGSGYDEVVAAYRSLEDADAPWPRGHWLEDLLQRLEPGSRVLDLGCATGVPVAARVAQDHHVVGLDLSQVQVEEARRQVPEGTFLCADITEVHFPPEHLDAAISLYTFDHIPREKHLALLGRIHGWLRQGGFLLLSVEDADRTGAVSEWLGVSMYFSHFDARTTEQLVSKAGFSVIRSRVEAQVEGGKEIRYLFVLARKD